jgi:hypothetical protein
MEMQLKSKETLSTAITGVEGERVTAGSSRRDEKLFTLHSKLADAAGRSQKGAHEHSRMWRVK